MPSLDLNLLPFVRQNGQDSSNLPGLFMVTPPRQAARGRSSDQVILFFNMMGNAPLTDQQQVQILGRLAQTYYKTAGSVTAALKTTMDAMNQFLLDRNLRSSSNGMQCIGLMTLLVLRKTSVILAQSGPVHTFLITQEGSQEFFDPQGAGRGLGLTRAVSIRYYQAELHSNDLLLLTPQPAPTWNITALRNPQGQGLESLRRRLLSQAGADITAVIIQVQVGTGKLRLLRTKVPVQMAQPATQPETGTETKPGEPAAAPSPQAEEVPAAEKLVEASPATQPEAGPVAPEPAAPPQDTTLVAPEKVEDHVDESKNQPTEPAVSEAPPKADVPPAASPVVAPDKQTSPATTKPEKNASQTQSPDLTKSRQASTPARPPARVRTAAVETAPPPAPASKPVTPGAGAGQPDESRKTRLPSPSLPKVSFLPVKKAVVRIGQAIGGTLVSIGQGIQGLLKRILPDESLFTIPAPTMAFIAIAVALIMASAGGAVYFQRGRAAQYQSYYEQALVEASKAVQQTTPIEVRTAWETTLDYLDKADSYRTTSESSLLRAKAMEALDNLDGIVRLDFQPAITSALGGPAEVSRIVANDTDLYLLNSQGGNVLRATLTGRGYEIDPNFTCGPNPKIGPLIDMYPLAKGNDFKATILAMDVNGNLLYCIPGSLPIENAPAPPQTGWGAPIAFTLDSGDLYALDPKTNGVWIYRNMAIDHQPHLFFGNQVPYMPDVVSFAVNNDDLYLLHQDGHLTICIYSSLQVSATRCTDPVTYIDHRQGRQDGPVILDARFNQILYALPPDPSIYMLDSVHQAIYHFSVKLTLQEQFRSKNPLPANTNATAFTVTQNRMVFMAVGNQIYYASLP